MNTHVKYDNPTTYQSKVMTKIKVYEQKVKLLSSNVRGSRSRYEKGLARRNTHVKYENPTTYQSKHSFLSNTQFLQVKVTKDKVFEKKKIKLNGSRL
jgi:hypothetical protein